MMGRTDIAKKDISKSNLLAHNLKKHHFSTETTYNYENLCGKKKLIWAQRYFQVSKNSPTFFFESFLNSTAGDSFQ